MKKAVIVVQAIKVYDLEAFRAKALINEFFFKKFATWKKEGLALFMRQKTVSENMQML